MFGRVLNKPSVKEVNFMTVNNATQKMKFSINDFFRIVIKPADSCGSGHIYGKTP